MKNRITEYIHFNKYLIANATGIPALVNFLNRRKLLVLAYHGIYDGPLRRGTLPETFVHVDDLRAQLSVIKRKYHVIDPEVLKNHLVQGVPLPPQTALVTFDDGYESFHRLAWPVLKTLGIRPIVFVTTINIEKNEPFWFDIVWLFLNSFPAKESLNLIDISDVDFVYSGAEKKGFSLLKRMKRLAPDERGKIVAQMEDRLHGIDDVYIKANYELIFPMTAKQVLSVADEGVTVGGHTHTHTILSQMRLSEAESDIATNKSKLESLTGIQCNFFAYPNGGVGDFNSDHKRMLRRTGFVGAFSLTQRRRLPFFDPMGISRINVAPEDTPQSLTFRCTGIVPVLERLRGN